VVSRQNADIADTLHLRDVAIATTFWLSMGYNVGCVIASGTLFDSRGRFLESSYPMKTADFEVLRDVAMGLFCSLAALDLRVGHIMDVFSPVISVLCHSD